MRLNSGGALSYGDGGGDPWRLPYAAKNRLSLRVEVQVGVTPWCGQDLTTSMGVSWERKALPQWTKFRKLMKPPWKGWHTTCRRLAGAVERQRIFPLVSFAAKTASMRASRGKCLLGSAFPAASLSVTFYQRVIVVAAASR